MNSKNVKYIRKQLRNIVQEQMEEIVTNALVEAVEARLREVFGARLESINDSIMSQLKSMDDRSKDVQQFVLNQATAEFARTAPKVELDEKTPDSAILSTLE